MGNKEIETKPVGFTFDDDALAVAQAIEGALVISEGRRFLVREAKGFRSENIKRKEFSTAQEGQVGIATGSPYRSTTLVNISTRDLGLVMPTALSEIRDDATVSEISGPGHVAKAFGIGNFDKVRIIVDDPHSKILRITKLQPVS